MEERERRWIKSRVREYYENAKIEVRDIDKREFGVGYWEKKIEQRHLAFSSIDELRGFLIEKAPLYVSYSTSFYKYPDKRPMEKKERIGNELTFDLDGEGSSLKEINKVKEEVKKLIDVLKEDFGVKEYLLNFSGSRGFHLHVYDEEYLHLSGKARKRLVDYLLGDFDVSRIFEEKEKVLYGPRIDEKGYRGRFARTLKEIVEKRPKLLGRKVDKERWLRAVREGNYSIIPLRSNKEILKKVLVVKEEMKIKGIDVDAGVTYDVSKLIRMPDSIHGSTGFIAKSIRNEELESFNPYKDAVAFEGEEKVRYVKSFKVIEDGKEKIKKRGEIERISKSLAFHLIIKGFASLY